MTCVFYGKVPQGPRTGSDVGQESRIPKVFVLSCQQYYYSAHGTPLHDVKIDLHVFSPYNIFIRWTITVLLYLSSSAYIAKSSIHKLIKLE